MKPQFRENIPPKSAIGFQEREANKMKPQSRENIYPKSTIHSEEVKAKNRKKQCTEDILHKTAKQLEDIKTNKKRRCTEDIPHKKKKKTSRISEEEKKEQKSTNNKDAVNTIPVEKRNTERGEKPKGDAAENSPGTALGNGVVSDKSFSVLKEKVCEQTLKAIRDMGLTHMTEIQAQAIPHLLRARDLLGSAKTGSGKTLAFLIPAVECIYKLKFLPRHGTGCIIISPTRELSVQTFGILKQLMKYHDHHTYGLLVSGANMKTEKKKLAEGLNVVVTTPGRLLDHLQNTKEFKYKNLRCLVIDEADRILDIGFEAQMKQIINLLPRNRQTMLLSATLTKKVTTLIMLAVKKGAIYVGVDDDKDRSTVEGLRQGYLVCPSEKRFLMLYTILQKHRKKKKVIVFFGSRMSTKFHYEFFKFVDLPVMSMHGDKNPRSRTGTFENFCKAESGILLCTNVAARGLDIPNTDVIIQYDPPDSPEEYIHRVGRTARAGNKGTAMLIVRPEEIALIDYLEQARVPLVEYEIEDSKISSIQPQLVNLVSKHYSLHVLAKKAYKAYVKAYNCHRTKKIFSVKTLDLTAVAKSFGFTVPPVDMDLRGR